MEVFVVVEYFCPGSVYMYIHTLTSFIGKDIYLYNEFITETARHTKLIFDIFEFWLWLHKVPSSDENVDSSWNCYVIITFL